MTPYYCSLCGDLFSVSVDLIKHLIEHSDRSTAAKRVQPSGPRKYKRRRKLNGDSDNSDLVSLSELPSQRANKIAKQELTVKDMKKNVLSSVFPIPGEPTDFKLPDDIFVSIGKRVPVVKREEEKKSALRASTSAPRPKMIFTEKTRAAATAGKRKTRTMVQKQVIHSRTNTKAAQISLQQFHSSEKEDVVFEHHESSETWSNDDPNEDVLDTLMKRERKLSEKFTMDLVNDLQDILRSPLKTQSTGEVDEENEDEYFDQSKRRSSRPTTSRYGTPQKKDSNVKKMKNVPAEDELIFIKQELFEEAHSCEICGDTFEMREELRSHVKIHI